MTDTVLDKFIAEVREILGNEILNEQGAFLYSSYKTLKKGKYFILGLNPGGKGQGGSIENDIIGLKNKRDHNAILDEDWEFRKGGLHPIQKNLRKINEILPIDLSEICATNLYYTRSRIARDIKRQYLKKMLMVLKKLLNIVKPEVIISFGKEPYNNLLKIYGDENYKIDKLEDKPSDHHNWVIRSFKGQSSQSYQIKVFGIPHLSRYTIYTRPDILEWLKDEIK